MLIAARIPRILPAGARATTRARSKYALRFHLIPLRRLQRDFASHAMDLGFEPPLLGFFRYRHRVADAAPSFVELSNIQHGPMARWIKYNVNSSVLPFTARRRSRR